MRNGAEAVAGPAFVDLDDVLGARLGDAGGGGYQSMTLPSSA